MGLQCRNREEKGREHAFLLRIQETQRCYTDAHPLPRIETCLDALGGSKFLSTFDLMSGYDQVRMDPADVDKRSFVTHKGTFRVKALPFGLTNAGATLQRVMDVAMAGLNFTICLIYLDDIILFSLTDRYHLDKLGVPSG